MSPQIYLITPANPDPAGFARQMMAVLTGPEVAAVLVRRGGLDDAAYRVLAESAVQVGQAAGAAVLLEDDVDLVRRTGADGVHVTTGGAKAIRAAVAALKPEGIVGVGNVGSRHDAMSFGELDVDYLMFGPLSGADDAAAQDLALWWAETFEVPVVLSLPAARPEAALPREVEFIGLSDSIWTAPSPPEALAALERALGEPA